ncbi:unnamed protein product [Schistocephalus solidus]|uniref:Uncharacterized protein n=1 Tax=Schistocephalus solidus TaxID=70667 RepID=A0A183TKZ1_SCHSO|nr:unnamed protein product [Schistocephalus solidus]
MSRDLRIVIISPRCCRVFGNSRPKQSFGFSDVVALPATAPDPINNSRYFLPWQWVLWSHFLTPNGGPRSVCDSNSKWREKAADDIGYATTIFMTDEDVEEGQLLVFFILHRKMYVREDAVRTFMERERLITFDDDEGIIHIPSP